MKHTTSARRISSHTNPVTIIPAVPAPATPAPQAPAAHTMPAQAIGLESANNNRRASNPGTVAKTRNRRSFEQVVESLPTEYEEAAYASRRIQARELEIAKILSLIGPNAQRLILTNRPDLQRYVQQN